MKHNLYTLPRYEDLMVCDVCGCGEGTLATDCPGVPVPSRVQTLIHNGVVDFDAKRGWIGCNTPIRRLNQGVSKLGATMEEAASMFKRAAQAMAQFGLTFAKSQIQGADAWDGISRRRKSRPTNGN